MGQCSTDRRDGCARMGVREHQAHAGTVTDPDCTSPGRRRGARTGPMSTTPTTHPARLGPIRRHRPAALHSRTHQLIMSSNNPLTSLTPAEVRLLTFEILTEHFTWSPETLAKLGMECANHTISSVIDNDVEPFLHQHFAAAYDVPGEEGFEIRTGLNEDELGKGLVQLETLLESAIDKRFDLFELYLLRNVFTIPVELIPYLELAHQVSAGWARRECMRATWGRRRSRSSEADSFAPFV